MFLLLILMYVELRVHTNKLTIAMSLRRMDEMSSLDSADAIL